MSIIDLILAGTTLALAACTLLLLREIRHLHRRLDAHAHAVILLGRQHPAVELPAEPERPELRLIAGGLSVLAMVLGVLRARPRVVLATVTTVAAGTVAALGFIGPGPSAVGAPPSGSIPAAPIPRPSPPAPSAHRGRRRTETPTTPAPSPGVPGYSATPAASPIASMATTVMTTSSAPQSSPSAPTPAPSPTSTSTPTPSATCFLDVVLLPVVKICIP